ncbi:hypothetical protein FNV43_RR02540 [Rhamnella rubrinervis]|uniref:Disease resistance protein At4g27190-like leucine-rich repeats domain-containing protein n=1 Tax=Rhamnella rubrinervis TaxID=2594499 RepID=A0A8K0MU20_9ROSA|nr:hypothetical protein FNV43_RR02540 [Rhamnella rubrinervis]
MKLCQASYLKVLSKFSMENAKEYKLEITIAIGSLVISRWSKTRRNSSRDKQTRPYRHAMKIQLHLALGRSFKWAFYWAWSENLYIDGIQGLKNDVFELDREEGLPHLKYLQVEKNDEIQYIIESMEHNRSNHNVLPSLDNLGKICFGELTGLDSLGKLREVHVYACGKLKSLLPLSIAKKLEKIKVNSCSTMEDVVTYSADHDHHDSVEFPKLREMRLSGLPNLIGFWSECEDQEILSATKSILFNKKVAFPSLESLELWDLNIEGIWLETSCNYKLQNLRSLIVCRCHSLKYLFSFPIARSLSQLEHLEVIDCRNMEEILVVNSDDQLAQVDLFPKLKYLKLGSLGLRHPPNESESVEGRQGSHSDIYDHQSNSASAATTFFNPKVIGFPSLETLYLKKVNMERLWLIDHQLAAETFYSSYLQNLRKLVVGRCHRLKYLFPLAIAQCLVQLQELQVSECRDMEEILFINYKELPASNTGLENYKLLLKLQVVSLEKLPNLIGFCSRSTGYNIVNCGLIREKVKISECPNLFAIDETNKQENDDDQDINSISEHKLKVGFPDDALKMCRLNHQFPTACSNITILDVACLSNSEYLMSAFVATSLVHLKKLNISKCGCMKEVLVMTKEFRQGRSGKIGLFPSLKYISLKSLPELEGFCRGYKNDMEYLLNLKDMVIRGCGKLATFISNSTDEEPQENLVSRQPLFHDETMVQHGDQEEFLSNLVMLKMGGDVPKLLMDVLGSHRYGARTTIFQNLECLRLDGCEKLEKLLMPSWGFQALAVLSVVSCNGMEYLLTPSTAKSLPLLKVMCIYECYKMRVIIHAKDDDELQGSSSGSLKNNNIVFHNLEFLVLDRLTSLTCFHSGNCALEFPKLSHLAVGKCPEMRNFCAHVIVTAPKLLTFIGTNYTRWSLWTELDSNDHVQVDYRVFDCDNDMNIEQHKEDGGDDKYININVPIQHLWETGFALKLDQPASCSKLSAQLHDHPHRQIASSHYSLSLPWQWNPHPIRLRLHNRSDRMSSYRSDFCDWVCAVAFGDGFGVGFHIVKVVFNLSELGHSILWLSASRSDQDKLALPKIATAAPEEFNDIGMPLHRSGKSAWYEEDHESSCLHLSHITLAKPEVGLGGSISREHMPYVTNPKPCHPCIKGNPYHLGVSRPQTNLAGARPFLGIIRLSSSCLS